MGKEYVPRHDFDRIRRELKAVKQSLERNQADLANTVTRSEVEQIVAAQVNETYRDGYQDVGDYRTTVLYDKHDPNASDVKHIRIQTTNPPYVDGTYTRKSKIPKRLHKDQILMTAKNARKLFNFEQRIDDYEVESNTDLKGSLLDPENK